MLKILSIIYFKLRQVKNAYESKYNSADSKEVFGNVIKIKKKKKIIYGKYLDQHVKFGFKNLPENK